jgi:hypothetical protein
MPGKYGKVTKKASQSGVSGYAKSKKKTLSELDQASDVSSKKDMNPVDKMADEMNRELESSKGITDYIRNIFND